MAIVLPPDSPKSTSSAIGALSSLQGWRLLTWVGAAFVIMGATDVGLAWYPTAFGTPEWEFGAISATLNGLALPTLGIYLVLGGSIARDRQMSARVVGTVMFAVAASLLATSFIYATVAPLALKSVADNVQLTAGIQKAVIKAGTLFLVYVVLFVAGGIQAWRMGSRFNSAT